MKIEKKLILDEVDLPSFYENTWIWTFNVSIGWIMQVAKEPDNPPIINGAKASEMLYLGGCLAVDNMRDELERNYLY